MVRYRPEIEPVVALDRGDPARPGFREGRGRAQGRAVVPLAAGGAFPGGHPQHQAASGRVQVPRGDGDQLGPPAGPNLGRFRAAPSHVLGPRQFQGSQAQDVREGDWVLGRVNESGVPSPHRARAEYTRAMEAWDADAADAAVAGLCRSSGAAETMEPIWRMAVRDQRNIGHKAIFAAQSWRTLQAIGWEHAEPVLRSLTFGLLDLQGDRPRPLGPYEANLENAAEGPR